MTKALALFDFDGTLTTKDSLIDFIQFAFGKQKTLIGGILLSPTLASYALGLINNNKAKQQVLKYFFNGMPVEKMRDLGDLYVKELLPKILRPEGLKKLRWHQDQCHEIVIVSASAEFWLQPWTESMGFELLATQLEVKNNKLTGCYLGRNCHGDEKVNRILELYKLQDYDTIYAYGDTAGDKPMLAIAHHAFYKPFR